VTAIVSCDGRSPGRWPGARRDRSEGTSAAVPGPECPTGPSSPSATSSRSSPSTSWPRWCHLDSPAVNGLLRLATHAAGGRRTGIRRMPRCSVVSSGGSPH
jgi:hypothetical protein